LVKIAYFVKTEIQWNVHVKITYFTKNPSKFSFVTVQISFNRKLTALKPGNREPHVYWVYHEQRSLRISADLPATTATGDGAGATVSARP
jgi:hypothetical protein